MNELLVYLTQWNVHVLLKVTDVIDLQAWQ